MRTIRGVVDSGSLGRTLSHEHFTAGTAGMERDSRLYDLNEAAAAGIEALRRARVAGIDSLIDLTPLDLGRQMPLFQRIAEADTGVQVVCATGVYRWVGMHLLLRDPDDIAELFVRDIVEGIEGTGIRAGIIKVAWDVEYRLTADGPAGEFMPRAALQRIARAAARAAKATGVPISCHTRATDELGTPLLDLFESEGLDLAAVTIGHSNDSDDIEYLQRLAARGANIGLDRYGGVRTEEENLRRARLALKLAESGHAAQVSLGHDASPYYRMRTNSPVDPDCWLKVSSFEIPWLLANGVSQEDIDAMQITSVRRTFDAAAAMAL